MIEPLVHADATVVRAWAEALRLGPELLAREVAKAFGAMGASDTARVRAMVGQQFGKHSAGGSSVANTFHYAASDPARAKSVDGLFLSVYTKWDAAAIFQTGGVVRAPGGKYMTVTLPAGYQSNGRRRYTDAELRAAVAAGRLKMVPTPKGLMVFEVTASRAKATRGEPRLGRAIALLKREVKEPKLLYFFETVEANAGVRQDLAESAVEDAFVQIVNAAKP